MARRSKGPSVLATSVMQLEGGEELVRKLLNVGAAVVKVTFEAAMDGAEVIEARADDLAPGPNIETEYRKSEPGRADVAIGYPKDKFYYMFFELGTTAHEITEKVREALKLYPLGEVYAERASVSGIPAQPFLRPAVDEKGDEARDAVGERYVKEIKKYEESK